MKVWTLEEIDMLERSAFEAGREVERQDWKDWFNRIRTWNPKKSSDYLEGATWAEVRIVEIIKEQPRVLHDGLVNANQLLALIKGESAKGSVEPAQLEVLIKGQQNLETDLQ